MLRFLASISLNNRSTPNLDDTGGKMFDFACKRAGELFNTHRFSSPPVGVDTLSHRSSESILWNENRDVALLWRGELFHDSGDLGTLASRQLKPSQLGIFILQQYEKLGIPGLSKLNGCFSGLLVDLRTRDVIVFTDRYGLNRVYVHEDEQTAYFASEAKFILAAKPELRQLELVGLGEWMSCGCVLQNRSLFKGISLLPPGAAWIYSPKRAARRMSYFDPGDWINQSPLSAESFEEELLDLFPSVVRRYFAGHPSKELAMSLTGGLDGRMVMAWSPAAPGDLPCYTFNGPIRDCADVRIGRKLAAATQQPHQTIPIASDFFEQFPSLARECIEISDGAMDVSGAAEIYVNRLAREIAPIRLTGNYGSETLRSNVAFRPAPIDHTIFAPEVTAAAAQAREIYQKERYSAEGTASPLSFIVFKQVPWHHYSRWSVEQSQLVVRSPFLDNSLLKLLFRAPRESLASLEPSLKLIAAGNPSLARIPTDRGVTWPSSPLKNNSLRKYHEFWAKAEYAYDYGMPNSLAKLDKAFSFLKLERVFLGRQKFCHYRSWYRTHLASFLRETLFQLGTNTLRFAQPSAVRKAVEAHINGSENHTLSLHKLLSLALIEKSLQLDGRA